MRKMTFRRCALPWLALAVLSAGACGKGGSPMGNDIDPPSDADALVLRVERVGGFLPPEQRLRELPMFSLYGDGRAFTLGAQIQIYPPPALAPLVVRKISPEGIEMVLEEARKAGLMRGDRKIEDPTIMDAPTTVFTIHARGEKHRVEVYALNESNRGNDEERDKILRFQQELGDLSFLSEGMIVEPEKMAELERLELIAFAPGQDEMPEESINPGTKEWPLSTPIHSMGGSYEFEGISGRCLVVEDEQLVLMLDALRTANQLTLWTSEDKSYRVINRPVFPDERGCIPPKKELTKRL